MATTEGPWTVPVSYVRQQKGLRLLELPPELNEVISSKQLKKLSIKSSPATWETPHSENKAAPKAAAPHVVLCTDTQTYQMRQVQSSNTVLIASPAKTRTPVQDDQTEPDLVSAGETIELNVFATCSNFLELNPLTQDIIAATKIKPAEQWLQQSLKVFDESVIEDMSGCDTIMTDDNEQLQGKCKREIYADIPFSQSECEDAWQSMCAFELKNTAMAPSAEVLLRAWKEVFQSFDMSRPFELAHLFQMAQETQTIPTELIDSIVRRISAQTHLELKTEGGKHDKNSTNEVVFDSTATATMVGEIHFATLLYYSGASDRDKSLLSLESWKELLPEAWRDLVTLELLATLRHERFKPTLLSSMSTLRGVRGLHNDAEEIDLLKLVDTGRESGAGLATKPEDLDGATPGGKKPPRNRNWHERLKKSRISK